jgi:Tol biopolymer transport system component
MDEREVRERLNDAADAFRFELDGSDRIVKRTRTRLLLTQALPAMLAVGAIVVGATVLTGQGSGDTPPPQPAGDPAVAPPVDGIDQAFVDSINECDRLALTPQQVESALGFLPDDPVPWEPNVLSPKLTPARVERWEGAGGFGVGCEYTYLPKERDGGQVVVTAYPAADPPTPLGRSRPVQGLGDEATFSLYGNGFNHIDGPEGATSVLEVRSGDLILRFNAGIYEYSAVGWTGAEVPGLRQLAADAFTTLAEGTEPVSGLEDDYTIDLNTREMTPLPEAIRGSVDETALGSHYAASSDGAMLAFVGQGEEGKPQIFTTGIDGSDIRQVTHDPRGATSPAWSPDGTKIAYESYGHERIRDVFLLDVATGGSTKLTEESTCPGCLEPTFTPDGSSVLYTAGSNQSPGTRIVPVTGGNSRLFIGPGEGVNDAMGASLSPDGSLVTFMGSGFPESEEGHCGPCRFIANADGSNRRVIPGHGAVPAGTWSPDGSRIVVSGGNLPPEILVVDVATREATHVADGSTAIWLDDHTLLVEVCTDPAFPCG